MNDNHLKIITKTSDQKIYLDCKSFFLNELRFIRSKITIVELAKKMAYFSILAYECDVINYYVNDNTSGVIGYVGDNNNYHSVPIVIKNILPKKCLIQMSVFIAKNQNMNYKIEIKCTNFNNYYNGRNLSLKSKYIELPKQMRLNSVYLTNIDKEVLVNNDNDIDMLDNVEKLVPLKIGSNSNLLNGIMRFATSSNNNYDNLQYELDESNNIINTSNIYNEHKYKYKYEQMYDIRYIFKTTCDKSKMIEIIVLENISSNDKIYKLIQIRKFISCLDKYTQ